MRNTIDDFLMDNKDGVFYTGHASILTRLSGKYFLFDPVKVSNPYGNHWVFYPELNFSFDYKILSGVFVSHIHQDHFDIDFLKELNQFCPIYIMGGRQNFIDAFKGSGVKPIVLENDIENKIDPQISIYGILHDSNGIDSSCVIKNSNLSIYHGNDNYCSDLKLLKLKQLSGKIHIACMPYAYINWYPVLDDQLSDLEKQSEAERLITLYMDTAIRASAILEANIVIPFGANLIYYDDAFSPLNMLVKTPIEFSEYANLCKDRKECDYLPLFSSDYILKGDKAECQVFQFSQISQHEFRSEINNYLDISGKRKHKTNSPTEIEKPRINLNITHNPIGLNHKVYFCSKDLHIKLELDLLNNNLKYTNNFSECERSIFKIEQLELLEFIRGNLKFDEIIGRRAFSISRIPNVYNSEIIKYLNTSL